MDLSQITVIAALAIAMLIGILVICALILANKVGKANATLRRIEEVLIAANASRGHAGGFGASHVDGLVASTEASSSPRAVEAGAEMPVPEVLSDVPLREVSGDRVSATDVPVSERDRRVSYLTVRDLKVMSRSGRRRSDPAVSQADAGQGNAAQLAADHGEARQADAQQAGAGQRESRQVGDDQESKGFERTGLSSSSAVLQDLAMATSEVRALLNEATEPPGATAADAEASHEAEPQAVPESAEPVFHTVENPTVPYALEERTENLDRSTTSVDDQPATLIDDIDAEVAERRKRNAELILAGQRRRRRARGY